MEVEWDKLKEMKVFDIVREKPWMKVLPSRWVHVKKFLNDVYVRLHIGYQDQLNEFSISRGMLGIRIHQDTKGNITLDQHEYAQKILEEFKMTECKPFTHPALPNIMMFTKSLDKIIFQRLRDRIFSASGGVEVDTKTLQHMMMSS